MGENRKVIRDCGGEGILHLCIDGLENGVLWGSIGSPHLHRWALFRDVNNLFTQLEGLLDEQGVPQAFHKLRRFKALGKKAASPRRRGAKALFCQREGEPCRGRMATLILCITSRQDASWQGYARWMDTDQALVFGSELELLHLILAHQMGTAPLREEVNTAASGEESAPL